MRGCVGERHGVTCCWNRLSSSDWRAVRAQVAPGAAATLRVRLDPAQLTGRYDGYVVAYTNDPVAAEITLSSNLRLCATMISDLRAAAPNSSSTKERLFPSASLIKVPIMAAVFEKIRAGQLSLDTQIKLNRGYRVGGSGSLKWVRDGTSLSVMEIVYKMITESDNTATDLFLEAIGGPAAVTGWLREIGIEDLRVDRSTVELLRDYAGTPAPEPGESYSAQYRRLLAEGKLAAFALDGASEGYIAFEQDPRDQGTPAAMSRLLAGLWRGELLSSAGIELLRGAMLRCRTGENRLRGRLPEGTVVAHKSGTITGTVNDVGVIALPGDRGRLVISVYVKNAVGDRASHERAIAEIARVAYDYFALNDFGSDD